MRIGEERKAAEFNADRSGQRQPEPGSAAGETSAPWSATAGRRGAEGEQTERGEPSDAGAGHLNPAGQHAAGTGKREPRPKLFPWKGD